MKVALLCLVLLCFIDPEEARGGRGGRGGGGRGGGGISVGGGIGSNWYHWLLIILAIISVLFLIYACCACIDDQNEDEDNTSTTLCYMCLNRINNEEWNNGEHRKTCFSQNQHEISSYPKPLLVFCPKCGEKLRRWPKKDLPFKCNNMEKNACASVNTSDKSETGHPSDSADQEDLLPEIISSGTNRFNCFLCDFDLCEDCVFQEVNGNKVANDQEYHKIPTETQTYPHNQIQVQETSFNNGGHYVGNYPVDNVPYAIHPTSHVSSSGAPNVVEGLARLNQLKQQGGLTEEEFKAAKFKVLNPGVEAPSSGPKAISEKPPPYPGNLEVGGPSAPSAPVID